LVSEYRALRSSVLRLWADGPAQDLATDMADVARFNEAVDQALAESVARYAKMVKQSQNMFLAILGHDLRNPLGTVTTGATFIMRASEIPPKYVLAATRIFNSGQRMSKLINDLIDFTRTHLGSGLPVKPRKADLAEVCMNVIDEMRTLHAERVIAFDVIGKADAVVDDDRISQVLSNLIGNAIQHGDKRSPIVVQLCATLDDVVITVNNRGDTIDNNTLAGIFEPLVRMNRPSASESNRDTSLGIGLFIAREIVAAHRGRISAESDDSTGTTFTVTLPRLTEAATVAA
ncbi:MAG TPA: HAMP domain-containing sensor histidine kinase, partial [Burkholderiaceae bacterium]